jgi:ABC-2 type transport system ATP-binding protein
VLPVADFNLEVRNLGAAYGRHVVLKDVSLRLPAGEWFALMGPNGCGKSTLLDCIVGKLAPLSGQIRIAGHPLLTDSANARRALGYACAPDRLPPLLTARQCFEVHAGAKGQPTIDDTVMALADELKFLPYLESFVDTLSLGTRQKLAVLLCLVGDPKLIVLDEAFNGLDPASSLALKRHLQWRLKNRGATLILATHALDIVERYADHGALLLDGVLAREWTKSEIEELRRNGRGFEAALVDDGDANPPGS